MYALKANTSACCSAQRSLVDRSHEQKHSDSGEATISPAIGSGGTLADTVYNRSSVEIALVLGFDDRAQRKTRNNVAPPSNVLVAQTANPLIASGMALFGNNGADASC